MELLANKVKDMGYAVYVPCNDILTTISGGARTHEEYCEQDLAFLEVCDIMFVRDEDVESSKGVQGEIKKAEELGIEVVYVNDNEIL